MCLKRGYVLLPFFFFVVVVLCLFFFLADARVDSGEGRISLKELWSHFSVDLLGFV